MISLTDQTELQQEQPQFYENLTKQLGPEEQQVLQGAIHHADVIAQNIAQQEQAAQQQAVAAAQQAQTAQQVPQQPNGQQPQ